MQKKTLGRGVPQLLATIALLLVATPAAAQSLNNGSYSLRVPALEVRAAANFSQNDKPSFIAPLIIAAAGYSTAIGALAIGVFSQMGTCTTEGCDDDRRIPTPMVVTAIVGGSVGVLASIWLVERLIARGAYSREQRGLSGSLHVVPTAGGAALYGSF